MRHFPCWWRQVRTFPSRTAWYSRLWQWLRYHQGHGQSWVPPKIAWLRYGKSSPSVVWQVTNFASNIIRIHESSIITFHHLSPLLHVSDRTSEKARDASEQPRPYRGDSLNLPLKSDFCCHCREQVAYWTLFVARKGILRHEKSTAEYHLTSFNPTRDFAQPAIHDGPVNGPHH